MNLDSLSFALAEISYSVANLTKKNFKSSVGEITHLVSQHGSEADRHLFRCLFSHVDFSGDGRSSGKDFHQSLRPSPQLFPQISKVLKLSRVQEVIFGLALLNSSNSDTRLYASQFVKQKLPDLLRSYIDADIRQEGGLQDVAIEVLHLLLTNLFKTKDHFGIGDDQREAFLKTLKKDFPHGRVPVILGPLLYPEAEDIIVDKLSDTSNMPKSVINTGCILINVILQLKVTIHTKSSEEMESTPQMHVEECRSNLIQFGAKEITPASVAKVLGMMARTPSGLTEQSQGMNQASAAPGSGWDGLGDKTENPGVNTWNVEVFSAVIQDLAPHLSWRDVVLELDHAGFIVMNKRGFRILIQGLIRGLQEVFPVEFIYRPWKNTEGQPTWNTLKQELIPTLMPIFLGNHPNSAVVLHYAWHCQGHSSTIRTLIMHSMAEWYMRGEQHDQTRLSRILDVAQDLKALSMLLNATPFAFVIDLACLASRREYLKLDKWLTDKIREHGEPFIQTGVNFLKRRCPQLLGGPVKDDLHPQAKSQMLPPDTITTMLNCLQQCASQVSQELSEAIYTMLTNANVILNKPRPPPPTSVVGTKSTLPNLGPGNMASQIEGLDSNHPLGIPKSWGVPGGVNAGFPQALPPLTTTPTPGSPAKGLFQPLSQANDGLGTMQNLTLQYSGLNLGGQMGPPRTPGVNPLSVLGSQAVAKQTQQQQPQQPQQPQQQPPPTQPQQPQNPDRIRQGLYNLHVHDVYECMLRNLFEEYRFFPQYPERELHTTAVLFGGIIEKGLATYMALGIALRYVLEALKKPHNSKMYFFGIAALDRFKSRLKDYPQYCQHLAAIPHFQQFPVHLIEFVEYGSRSQEPPLMSQVSHNTPTVPPPIIPTVTTATITTESLMTTAITTAISSATTPVSAAAAIAAASNTKGGGTLPKAEELKKEVTEEYMPWVAQYLVMKRASIEPNFHTLYASFLDALQLNKLANMVIRETFRNIKVLLRSDKGDANFSDRTLLKNLGHWLGMLMLAKNKPILAIDIDLKALIYEAYHKGARELLYVVPFAAKVLESCAKSKVFRPPNPWTLGIMNVLAELHMEQDLKLNLKFEIEVLCKTLQIDLNDLKPGTYLKDESRLADIMPQLSGKTMTPQPEPAVPVLTATTPTVTTTTITTPTSTTTPNMPPQPQFAFDDIVTSSLSGISSHIIINDQVALFQGNPQLKQIVKIAIEKSIQELLPPVVERTIKITLTTCEQIIKKDFALDPEETRMSAAAHHMIRNMTAGLSLITCREPLTISIQTNLKNAFMNSLRGATQQQKELIEQSAQVIAQDNTELACAFIQKTAVERAIPEINKRLATEFELRKHARSEGRRYCDPVVLTYQAERMPEQIRLKVGGVTQSQISVYEEFAHNIPGFLPTGELTFPSGGQPKPMQPPVLKFPSSNAAPELKSISLDEISQIYEKVAREMEQHLQHLIGIPPGNPLVGQLQGLLEAVALARNSHDIAAARALIQKAVEALLEHYPNPNSADQEFLFRFRECNLLVLKGLQDQRAYGPQWINKQVTRCLIEIGDEYKYNFEAIDLLIRSQLVNLQQYDLFLAQHMENGANYMAVGFAMQLVQRYCVDEKHNTPVTEADFSNTIEALTLISTRTRHTGSIKGLSTLLENLRPSTDFGMLDRALGGPTHMMQSGISQARELNDPPELPGKTEFLLREWVNMYHSPAAGRDSTKAFTAFVQQMNQQEILKTDDLITRFFRLCTEMCVDLCYRALAEQTHSPALVRAKCFHTLDAFVRLIALLIKHSGDTTNTVTKINLLNKVVTYMYILIFIFHICSNTFHVLRPAKAPGFAYAWLELISHRVFIGRMLALTPQQKGWGMYAQLLIDLFKFLAPFLRNADLTKPSQLLYKGTLRVLLVLLHDFPEFLCDYHYAFCDVIPPNCIQMRNLILSAFPRNMRLPDPFTPHLKVDMLADIANPPRILTNVANMIQPASFKKDLDSYLKSRSPVTFLSDLRSNLQSNEPGTRYNIPLMNALVLYVGTQAIQFIHSKGLTPSMSTISHSAHMDIFQNLGVDLDTEGRYLFLTAIANQLRYPNSHTHYFSCTLLYLFAEANTEAIQEQITRVLLERLIVNRPHPWGLLITFIELIKNPQFKFWNHEFVHCAPEIEKVFETVARSCMQPKQGQVMRDPEPAELH
ncbi:hypothetical protein KUTeg_018958 [Tegillarca granosa]|uniref:CCR4-NOT transcription complex subunit 1 n=1 Tax=Tegillarca granosa TaxID=220873 RepID=A0ABQ9EG52_TEGGR|nr:hypothetical protein KUTeg_018958 [Tegillarca granosa]